MLGRGPYIDKHANTVQSADTHANTVRSAGTRANTVWSADTRANETIGHTHVSAHSRAYAQGGEFSASSF